MIKPKVSLDSVEKSLNVWLKPKRFGESWDNIGLIVESSLVPKKDKCVNNIFLCNDLTAETLQEAIETKADLIIAYHPPLFPSVKPNSNNHNNSWKTEVISDCLASDISIYSPHTSLDAIIGGINDRIASAFRSLLPLHQSHVVAIKPKFLKKNSPGISFTSTVDRISALYSLIPFSEMDKEITASFTFVDDSYNNNNDEDVSLNIYLSNSGKDKHLEEIKKIAKNMNVHEFESPTDAPAAALGSGRILSFNIPVSIVEVTQILKECTGVDTIKLAHTSKKEISSIAICVGSGAAYLKGLNVDAVFTGEMTQRDALDFVQAGQSVILCGHAESERHYLPTLAAIAKIVTQAPNVTVSSVEQAIFQFV